MQLENARIQHMEKATGITEVKGLARTIWIDWLTVVDATKMGWNF